MIRFILLVLVTGTAIFNGVALRIGWHMGSVTLARLEAKSFELLERAWREGGEQKAHYVLQYLHFSLWFLPNSASGAARQIVKEQLNLIRRQKDWLQAIEDRRARKG